MTSLILASLVTGAVYTVTALGLITVYKTTRVFNFAHGLLSGLCCYVTYQVVAVWEQPFIVGVIAAVVAGTVLSLLMERIVLAGLYRRSPIEIVIATVGASMILQFLVIKSWGHLERAVPEPFGGRRLEILGGSITYYGVAVLIATGLVVTALSLTLLRTRLGLQFRLAFDDPIAARLVGVNVGRIRSLSWALGGSLAGLAGALVAPLIILSPTGMSVVLITAFAAAVIGGFSSFYGAAVGGLLVALIINLGGAFLSVEYSSLILYAAVVVLLWFRPFGLLGTRENEDEIVSEGERRSGATSPLVRRMRDRTRALGAAAAGLRERVAPRIAPQWALQVAAILVVTFALPLAGASWRLSLGSWLVTFIAVAGLSLVMTYGHRFFLAQAACMGFGGYTTALLVQGHPQRWIWAVVLTALIGAAVVALLMLASIRVTGAYFAALTLVIALAFPHVINAWDRLGGANGLIVETPEIAGKPLSEDAIYQVVAITAIAVLLMLIAFRNTALGRRMTLVTSAPRAAASIGASRFRWQLAVLTVGGTLGVLAGSLGALQAGIVAPTSYTLDAALMLFVGAVIGGSITGALWGSALVALVPVLVNGAEEYAIALFGLALVVGLRVLPFDMSGIDILRLRRTRPVRAIGSDGELVRAGT